MMLSAATDYVPFANQISEEARKKLRVDRLRQSTMNKELSHQVLENANAGEWAKQQTLRQIQIVREMKKREMMSS